MRKITPDDLRDLGACDPNIHVGHGYPNVMDVRIQFLGAEWLANQLAPVLLWNEYMMQRAPLSDEYTRQYTQLWNEYVRQCAPLLTDLLREC